MMIETVNYCGIKPAAHEAGLGMMRMVFLLAGGAGPYALGEPKF